MFGLDAQVQEKRVGDRTSRWIVRVDTRRPGAPRTHLKTVQRVKVEITAQHPDDRSVAQAVSPYPRIVPHWSLSIPTESSLAVVGQKLQALPSSIAERRNPRYRDIWDIANVTGFFNFSNRVAMAAGMTPNPQYHDLAREPAGHGTANGRKPA